MTHSKDHFFPIKCKSEKHFFQNFPNRTKRTKITIIIRTFNKNVYYSFFSAKYVANKIFVSATIKKKIELQVNGRLNLTLYLSAWLYVCPRLALLCVSVAKRMENLRPILFITKTNKWINIEAIVPEVRLSLHSFCLFYNTIAHPHRYHRCGNMGGR